MDCGDVLAGEEENDHPADRDEPGVSSTADVSGPHRPAPLSGAHFCGMRLASRQSQMGFVWWAFFNGAVNSVINSTECLSVTAAP